MLKRVLIASVLATPLLMMTGFLFWGLSPLPAIVMSPLPDTELALEIKKKLPESGTYFYPFPVDMTGEDTEEKQKVFAERHQAGPIFHLFYNAQGQEHMPPSTFVFGFIHYFFTALLAGSLLAYAAPKLPKYIQRVGFVLLLGLFSAVWINLSNGIWFYHPWGWCLLKFGYSLYIALFMGLVLAAIIRPIPEKTA